PEFLLQFAHERRRVLLPRFGFATGLHEDLGPGLAHHEGAARAVGDDRRDDLDDRTRCRVRCRAHCWVTIRSRSKRETARRKSTRSMMPVRTHAPSTRYQSNSRTPVAWKMSDTMTGRTSSPEIAWAPCIVRARPEISMMAHTA